MMGRFIYANADRASFRTQQRRREKDIAYLAKLAGLVAERNLFALLVLASAMAFGPPWKRIAVHRAIAKVKATTEGGTP